ncbi:MAG: hypothetical protein ACRCZF_15125 [Gemmataceae bacterium]
MDVSEEDLFEAIDAAVRQLLETTEQLEPPVDAVLLVQMAFGFRIQMIEPEDEEPLEYGEEPRRPRRPPPRTLVFKYDQSEESQQAMAARACAKAMLPGILQKIGIAPGTENRGLGNQLGALIATRLLLPTRWFARSARQTGFDLMALKDIYPSASYEALARRMLDVAEEPMVMAIVEDGSISWRRGNRFAAPRKLHACEELCIEQLAQTEVAKARAAGWTAWGWATPGIPFRRIVLRSEPDDIY